MGDKNLKRIVVRIEEVKDSLSAQVLRAYALELETDVVAQVDKYGINDRGDLRKSITHEFIKRRNNLILRVGPGILKPFPYPIAVHEGTRPHFPPADPIRKWVRRKLGIRNRKELEQVTRAIQWKIYKHGTKGRPFLKDVLERRQGRVEADMVKIARRLFNDVT